MSETFHSGLGSSHQQRLVLQTYFHFLREWSHPPCIYDDPLFALLILNELTSQILLLSLQCRKALQEAPEALCTPFRDPISTTCRSLAVLCLALDMEPEHIWSEQNWDDPRDVVSSLFEASKEGTFGAYVPDQLVTHSDQLVRRALATQQCIKQLSGASFNGEQEQCAVRDALGQLWHTLASLAVNVHTELAQILKEDMERLLREQREVGERA